MKEKLKAVVPKIVHSKPHKYLCAFGHYAEHPTMVFYALAESMAWHSIIVYVCYVLVGTGIFAITYEYVFARVAEGAGVE